MIMMMAASILMIVNLSVGTSWQIWDRRPRGGFLPSTASIHRYLIFQVIFFEMIHVEKF